MGRCLAMGWASVITGAGWGTGEEKGGGGGGSKTNSHNGKYHHV